MDNDIKITFAEEKARGAVLKVIGVGGAGGNAINRMIEEGLSGVEFIAINTDVQDLNAIKEPGKTLQIGAKLTRGLGTGSNAEIGNQSAQESKNEIINVVDGANMVFVTAGMGGGTGTGASPVIANHASTAGILTVAIVTKPFDFEGESRMAVADEGIEKLMKSVDSMIVIPNQKLIEMEEDEDMEIEEAYRKVDTVLLNAVEGISSIINSHGLNNTDFADVKAVMSEKGMTLMGTGEAKGDNRAEEAVNKALSSPLLGDMSISGATGVLYNITASKIGLKEISVISQIINNNVSGEVKIKKFGTVKNDNMKDVLRVTVIATGFKSKNVKKVRTKYEDIDPFNVSPQSEMNSREIKREEFSKTSDTKRHDSYFFDNRKSPMSKSSTGVRENRHATLLSDFAKSDYINNNVPHMGNADSFGDDNDFLDSPTFQRKKITEK